MQHVALRFAENLRLYSGVSDLDDPELNSVQSADADSIILARTWNRGMKEAAMDGPFNESTRGHRDCDAAKRHAEHKVVW